MLSPRFSQLMSEEVAAIASCGWRLTPVGTWLGCLDEDPAGEKEAVHPLLYALLGARSVPQGFPGNAGSHASCTDSGMPLE